VLGAGELRQTGLQFGDFRAHDELAVIENSRQPPFNVRPNGF
jgi:uncharacterized ferritin-like protein (DUF455 family)